MKTAGTVITFIFCKEKVKKDENYVKAISNTC